MTRAIAHQAHQRGSDAVVAVSHTRAAAAELAGRNAPINQENVATLHALAYRALDRPEVAEGGDGLRAFAEAHPQWLFTATRDPEDVAYGDATGDALLGEYSRLRNMRQPRPLWPVDVLAFASAWEAYKHETESIDFTDMIEYAAADTICAPQDPEVLVVDEAQDMTRLQWSLVQRWASAPHCETLVTAGDPDQALYQWAGADIRWFAENPPARRKVLEDSYRVPRAVHALAQHWIRQCTDREDITYRPRDADGAVLRSPATWRAPEPLMRVIEQAQARGQSVMIQASCSYMIAPTVAMLRKYGIPFSNPWRRKRGDWNPLHRRNRGTLAAIAAFMVPHTHGRVWSRDELLQWLSIVKGVLPRGGRQRIEDMLTDASTEDDVLWRLGSEIGEEHLAACLAAPPANLIWLQAQLKAAKVKPAEFPLQLIRQHGMALLEKEPSVYVGTCHSFKGGEADVSVIFPDLSSRGLQAWLGTDRNSVLRLFYVALTRAREAVVLASAATGAAVW